MVIFVFFLKALATVLHMVFQMVMWSVIIRAVLSWVNPDPYNPIVRFLNDFTDPLIRPIRRFVPLIGPGFDLSPIVLILVVVFLDELLVGVLTYYARELAMMG